MKLLYLSKETPGSHRDVIRFQAVNEARVEVLTFYVRGKENTNPILEGREFVYNTDANKLYKEYKEKGFAQITTDDVEQALMGQLLPLDMSDGLLAEEAAEMDSEAYEAARLERARAEEKRKAELKIAQEKAEADDREQLGKFLVLGFVVMAVSAILLTIANIVT